MNRTIERQAGQRLLRGRCITVQPTNYVNEKIIKKNWDDLLRLACTIKLKETTDSDIFRRLNSYSKQHDLYKAMKLSDKS